MGSLRTLFSSRTPRSFLNKRRNRQLGKGTNLERNSRLESGRRARRDSAGKNRRDGKHQGNDFEPLGRSNDRNGRRLRRLRRSSGGTHRADKQGRSSNK